MRIAQIAPLAESIPPKLYSGTERVRAWLVCGAVIQSDPRQVVKDSSFRVGCQRARAWLEATEAWQIIRSIGCAVLGHLANWRGKEFHR